MTLPPWMQSNKFKIRMPLLTQLQILVSSSVVPDFWEYLIPDLDKHGKGLEIPQIKTLSISFTTEDCESVHVTRFTRIFPNLTLFQHVARLGDRLHRCDHTIRDARLVKTDRSEDNAELLEGSIPHASYFIDGDVHRIMKMTNSPDASFWD